VTRGALTLRGRRLPWGERTYVMGILNATPDSFSGDGTTAAAAVADLAVRRSAAGADLLDLGAESTRPGHAPVDAEEEAARLLPALAAVRARLPEAIVSVDTTKPAVARAALAAGADIVNSVRGFDAALLAEAAAYGAPIVVVHARAEPLVRAEDVLEDVLAGLAEQAARALAAGIPRAHVLLDPGIGFGKTLAGNLAILRDLPAIVALGFPTLLGASRKSVIGALLAKPPHERLFGTAATTALAIRAGFDLVRVHDVAANRDVARVCDAVVRGRSGAAPDGG